MSSKFDKYLPENAMDNRTDGGYYDDRHIRTVINSDDRIDINPFLEKRYREENNIPEYIDLKDINGSAVAEGKKIQYDKATDSFYFIAEIRAFRISSKSTIHVIIDSDIFENKFDEIFELPTKQKTARGVIRVVMPTKRLSFNDVYVVNIKYKDSKDFRYHEDNKEYEVEQDENIERDYYDKLYNIYDIKKYEIEYDNTKTLIEYGYIDVTHGDIFTKIEGIEACQKEDGTWTSDAVTNPEKYLKSDLEWYYSDEREVQYLVKHNVFTEEQANAIRAANYEDIFSLEYKMKSAIKIIPIVLVIIIIAIIVIKKIKKRIF